MGGTAVYVTVGEDGGVRVGVFVQVGMCVAVPVGGVPVTVGLAVLVGVAVGRVPVGVGVANGGQ